MSRFRRILLTFLSFISVVVGSIFFPTAALADEAPVSPVTNKKIVISLEQQSLTAYDGDIVFLSTPVTTGGPYTPTPAGTYQVLEKRHNFVMRSPWPVTSDLWYPDAFVHYGLLFQTNGYYIHDASWRRRFGMGSNTIAGKPGGSYTGTHGCINVPIRAETILWSWAAIGTPVIIQ